MRVLLVDDHPLFREGLQYLLQIYQIEVAGVAGSAREAFDQAVALKPDMILMDVMMPDSSGLEALRMIKAELPESRIVMLTSSDCEQDVFEAYRHGASGYLLKTLNGQELIDMLRQLENGLTSITPGIAQHMLEDLGAEDRQTLHPQSAQDEMSEQLTERHKMILKLVAGGATYKEAAETLGLTERTIKYHMGRIVEILQLKNRSQAIAFAVRARLVDTDQDAID